MKISNKGILFMFVMWVGIILTNLVFWSFIAYSVIHFVKKYW